MPGSEARDGVRAFLLGGLATLGLGALLLGSLNAWVNPFGFFDGPPRPGVNDVPPLAFQQAPRARQMRWLARRAGEIVDGDVVVGTSRVLYGLDTCDAPELHRLALVSLSLREMAALAPFLNAAPGVRGLSFELSAPGDAVEMPAEGPGAWRQALFGWSTTQAAVATLWSSRREAPRRDGRCASDVHPVIWNPRMSPAERALASEQLIASLEDDALLARQQAALGELLEAYGPACARRGQRLRLFALPAYAPPARIAALLHGQRRQAEATEATLARYRARYPGCAMSWLDLASAYSQAHGDEAGMPLEDWRDAKHFTARRGAAFVQALLAPEP